MSLINPTTSIIPYSAKVQDTKGKQVNTDASNKLRMDRIVNSSLKAQFRDYSHFHQYGMGDVVVLAGTSTAGKSSIIKALKQLESERLEDGVDIRGLVADFKLLSKQFPNEIEILTRVFKDPVDIINAVFAKDRLWKPGVDSSAKADAEAVIQAIKKKVDSFSPEELKEQQKLFDNIQEEMFDEAFELSRHGKNVIFDVLSIDALAQHLINRNFNGPLRLILTYCPFHELSSRMEKRNKEAIESGELSNQRVGAFPLIQFSDLYGHKESGQNAIEKMTREQVTKAFNENYDKGIEANRLDGKSLPSDEEIALEKGKRYARFLKNLGFNEGVESIEIAPKNQQLYNYILNSSTLLAAESAKIIHEGTYKRYINKT